MATIVSALPYTIIDEAGNPRTEVWLTCEFGEAYESNGIAFDLSPYLKRIEHITTEWMSGGVLRAPVSGTGVFSGCAAQSGAPVRAVPVFTDYGTPGSARFMLQGDMVNAMVSGAAVTMGGMVNLTSGLAAAVSGVRFLARALGY